MNLKDLMKLETYTNNKINNKTLLYRVYLPKERKKSYRLFLFLHGAGERGSDGELHIRYNVEILENIINHSIYGKETIIIAPQVPIDDYWINRDSVLNDGIYSFDNTQLNPTTALFKDFLDNELLKRYSIDESQIHIGGISMGAAGSAHLILSYPKKFASALLICGKLDLKKLNLMKDTPMWLFHSKDDSVVNYLSYDKAYPILKKLNNNVKYTLYEDAGHGSWIRAYKEPNLLEWIFTKQKSNLK